MEMSEDEILEEADRIRERRGLRVVKECAECGTAFAAAPGESYCSSDCTNASIRELATQSSAEQPHSEPISVQRDGESFRDYFIRTATRPLTPDDKEFIDAIERIQAIWANVEQSPRSSLELIHEGREERLRQLTSQ